MELTFGNLALLAIVACLSQFGSDIYTPSIPAISDALNTSLSLVQFSLAIYMIGVSLGQLVTGPLSEGFGRRQPLIVGLFLMFAGGVVCVSSYSIVFLLIGRCIQGLGGGVISALWRSIVRDHFQGEEMAKYVSYLTIIVVLIIPSAPLIGGYLQHYFSWRANFAFLVVYALIALFLVILKFSESNKFCKKYRLRKRFIVCAFKHLFFNRQFMGYTTCAFLSYGGFFSWFVIGPVLVIHTLKYSPIAFGWITFVTGAVAIGAAGYLNAKLVTRFGISTLLMFGWWSMLVAGLLMFLFKWIIPINLYIIIVPAFIFYFGSAFIWPNVFAAAFKEIGKIAGYAASLYGLIQIGGGAAFSTLASFLPAHNQLPLSLLFIVSPLSAYMVFKAMKLR